jgi:hypothetical protein
VCGADPPTLRVAIGVSLGIVRRMNQTQTPRTLHEYRTPARGVFWSAIAPVQMAHYNVTPTGRTKQVAA